MVRNIDNFLSLKERELILEYMDDLSNWYNFGKRNEREFPDNEQLKQLYNLKKEKWKEKTNIPLPNVNGEHLTFQNSIENGDIRCYIYNFLITFNDLLDSDKCETSHWGMLDALERGIEACNKANQICPCPAEP